MNKLKLSPLNLDEAEVLTREQLKQVMGGLHSDPKIETWTCNCVNGGTETCFVGFGPDAGSNDIFFDQCCGFTGSGQTAHGSISSCW